MTMIETHYTKIINYIKKVYDEQFNGLLFNYGENNKIASFSVGFNHFLSGRISIQLRVIEKDLYVYNGEEWMIC